MASKRRLRRKRCGNKIRYPNPDDALLALRQLYRHQPHERGRMNIYKCSFCHKFHLGHRPFKHQNPG